MNAHPARLLIAILLLAAGSNLLGCGPEAEDTPSAVPFDTQAPTIPSGITATRLDDGNVLLSWRANRTDPDLAGYVIYRSATVESGFLPVLTDPVRSNSWLDDRAPVDGPVWYRIAARDASANESPLSTAVSPGSAPSVTAAAAVLTAPAR